ncbi:MAG: hypothetical protein H6694_04195 [Candidatus Latescibacteria bacterium]|nr:hypothetical protein [Candidatus Latescibacterota bacterium]
MRVRWILVAAALAGVLAGCGEEKIAGLENPEPDYLPYVSLDNLIDNLALAWEAGDLAEYRDSILYDGVMPAADGQVYAPFMFYYDRSSADPNLPVADDNYARELQRVVTMFAGLPGQDLSGKVYPGIKAIQLDLVKLSPWQSVADSVEADACPEGTQQLAMDTHILITLKSAIQGSNNITAWLVNDRALFTCIPTGSPDAPRWRLWKWRDVVTGKSESASFGAIKALY